MERMTTRYENVLEGNGLQDVIESESLNHPENYPTYYQFIERGEPITVATCTMMMEHKYGNTDPWEWKSHYNETLALLKDGIETELIQHQMVHVIFADDDEDGHPQTLDLTLMDYFLNLIMWGMLVRTETPICSYHVFFADEIKQDTIKDYIDRFLIDANRKRFTNKELNNIIDDTLCYIHDIDSFAMFFANTVNLEDNVTLMNLSPEFNQCMHADLSDVPIEDVKSIGMSHANKAIDIMKHSKHLLGYDHCLADACRASEGINPKQFKEFTVNIGTKPDGRGGIFPTIINKSFINGGVADPIDYFIESSTGRTAQIIKFQNVGSSGYFARLLGLNNMDACLHQDPNYDCGTTNFLEIVVKDHKTLKMLRNRYYRLHPNGIEMLIDPRKDAHLIGKKIYLRSPITCASAARGHGYCYKCYGDLAYTVFDAGIAFGVNIGRIASEILSSSLTQKLLSAKHLLETFVEKLVWVKKFNELFEVESNVIRVSSEIEHKDFKMIIDPDSIELKNEEDDDLTSTGEDDEDGPTFYNEYISEFDVLQISTGETFHICNEKGAELYISNELNSIIRRKGEPIDGKIYIDFTELKDISTVFLVPIINNELSKTLEHLENLLNKNSTIKGMNIHQLMQALIDTVIEGGLNIASTHLEVIVSNQIRDTEDILERAKWQFHNPSYEILSLNRALTNNPSITISLSYQKVRKQLYSPLTFNKHGASFMDLFFMEQPQYAIAGMDIPEEEIFVSTPGELFDPMIPIGDPNKFTAAPSDGKDDETLE